MSNPDPIPEGFIDAATAATEAEIKRLGQRLVALGIRGPATAYHEAHPATGEIIVCLMVGEGLYWFAGDDLIEQREAKGRVRYRRIGSDDEPGAWKDAPPPPSRSVGN